MKPILSHIENLFLSEERAVSVVEKAVPLLSSSWGVKDEDALVHSLGVNLLAAMGREAGYVGLVEFPTPRAEEWPTKIVRVDAAWIDPDERRPIFLAEFQKWISEAQAMEKAVSAERGCPLAIKTPSADKPPFITIQ